MVVTYGSVLVVLWFTVYDRDVPIREFPYLMRDSCSGDMNVLLRENGGLRWRATCWLVMHCHAVTLASHHGPVIYMNFPPSGSLACPASIHLGLVNAERLYR